jgi:hypothetical protein
MGHGYPPDSQEVRIAERLVSKRIENLVQAIQIWEIRSKSWEILK